MTRRAIPALLTLVLLAACSSGGAAEAESTPSPSTSAPATTDTKPAGAAADVVVASCTTNPDLPGMITAKLTITNSTDKPANYLVTLSANGADGDRVAELSGAANAIAAGQSATVDAVGMVAGDVPEAPTCVVANVTRM